MPIFNKDGTIFDPPILPEYEDLTNTYRSIGCHGVGYSCMYCARCIFGAYFKPNEKEAEIIESQKNLTNKYISEHGDYDSIMIQFDTQID